MIILIIDQNGVFPVKGKCEPPVTTHIHRPMTGNITVQLMQSPSRSVHILWPFRIVQSKELSLQFPGMFRLDAGFRAAFEKLLDPAVSKALDHKQECIA
ncbi:hypothetical protein BH20ACI2_BH20ACI2_24450 [soil metagenome]